MTSFGFVHSIVGFLPGNYSPTSRNFHVRRETADGHHLYECVCISLNIDRGDRVAESVGNIKSFAVCAQIKIARICSLEIRVSGLHLADLRKEWSGIYSENTNRVFEAIGDVESRTVRIEESLFAVESGFKSAEHGIIRGIDYAGKVCVLVQHHGVLNRIDIGV